MWGSLASYPCFLTPYILLFFFSFHRKFPIFEHWSSLHFTQMFGLSIPITTLHTPIESVQPPSYSHGVEDTHCKNKSVYCTPFCPNTHTVFVFGVCIGTI